MRNALPLTGLAAACILALAGCTPATHPAPSTRASAAHGAEAPGLPAGVTQATNVPTAVPNDPAQRKNVAITDCSRSDDGWTATGTAINPTAAAASYTITVFFTAATATVLAVGDTTAKIEANGAADWRISSDFSAPDGTRCVLSGVAIQQ